jgi:hypothetical protein
MFVFRINEYRYLLEYEHKFNFEKNIPRNKLLNHPKNQKHLLEDYIVLVVSVVVILKNK